MSMIQSERDEIVLDLNFIDSKGNIIIFIGGCHIIAVPPYISMLEGVFANHATRRL